MKFTIEQIFLSRVTRELDINPKDFLYCANVEELNTELEDYIHNRCDFPANADEIEELGMRYYQEWWNSNEESFYLKWQELKGLPVNL